MKRYHILFFVFFILFGEALNKDVFAQDPEFTQFYANPLYLNPAFAGTGRCPRAIMNYRNQWPALTGTFVTYNVSYDQYFDGIQGGLGLLVNTDKAGQGTISTTNISGMYAYQLNVTRLFSIRAAFQATYTQKSIDWEKLTFGDMIDKRNGFVFPTAETPGPPSRGYPDFSTGILAYSSKVFGGLAVHHLTEPNEAFINISKGSPLPKKITVHAGALLPLDNSRKAASYISPNILFQQQRKFQTLNIGLYFAKNPIVGGIWYRHAFTNPDALILLIGIQQGIFKFGYSYDVTVAKKLASLSGGSHEASFSIQFECRPKRKKFRSISCPSF